VHLEDERYDVHEEESSRPREKSRNVLSAQRLAIQREKRNEKNEVEVDVGTRQAGSRRAGREVAPVEEDLSVSGLEPRHVRRLEQVDQGLRPRSNRAFVGA